MTLKSSLGSLALALTLLLWATIAPPANAQQPTGARERKRGRAERKRVPNDKLGGPLREDGIDRCGFGVRHFSSSSGRPGALPSTRA